MARIYSRPVDLQALNQFPLLQEQLWSEAQIKEGMNTSIDPADIPDGALVLANQSRVRFDKTSRRFGYSTFSPADADTAPVLGLATWKQNNGSVFLVKLRPAGPRFTDFTAWFAPTGTALLGAATDRFDFTVAQNIFVFANNGVDFIQQLVTGSPGTFARLGNAPKARTITAFYNRIIAANYTDPAAGTPVTIGWSGDTNPTVWDTATDLSAGASPLIDSPNDVADYITRIFGFTNLMVVLRERSIWLATKQPIGTNPFYFFGAVAGIGCNCPWSVAVMPNGLVWVDLITSTVWAYRLGAQPERIGLPIEKSLISNVNDQTQVFGSYNGQFNEYTACIVMAGTNVRRLWTYNFISKAWFYDELPDASLNPAPIQIYSVFDSQETQTVGLTVASLAGTVQGLQGTVANLSPLRKVSTTRLLGDATGGVHQEDPTADTDDWGAYIMEARSKHFIFPDIDLYVSQIRIEYIAHKAGKIELDYSRDGGLTWIVVKTINIPQLAIERPEILRMKKNIKTRRFQWRILSSQGLFDILSFEVRVFAGAESRK